MRDTLLSIRFAVEFALKNSTLKHIKQFRRWYKDKKTGEWPLDRQVPWITYDAIDFLDKICTPDSNAFEWGSGGSTLFFAPRCKSLISIEHDSKWGGLVKDKLEAFGISNVKHIEIPGEKTDAFADKDYRNPDDFVSKNKDYAGQSFEKYVKAIDDYPNDFFDIVFVDGRARNCCIKRAIPHVKKGGFLALDNSDRKYYLEPFPELFDSKLWEKTEFYGPIFCEHAYSKTSFFRKL